MAPERETAPPEQLPATRQDSELAKLRRELSRLDTVLFLISAMVVVDTIGAIAIGGVQAFTWLVVLFALFFVPSALISAELGAAIPEEGGVYVWVRMAFGRFAGALTSLLYWAGTPMWLGGSIAAVAITVYGRFLGDLSLSVRQVDRSPFRIDHQAAGPKCGLQAFDGVVPGQCESLRDLVAEIFEDVDNHPAEQVLLVAEVLVDQADADLSLIRNRLHGDGVKARLLHESRCCGKDLTTPPAYSCVHPGSLVRLLDVEHFRSLGHRRRPPYTRQLN